MKTLAIAAGIAAILVSGQVRAADYNMLLIGPSYHTVRQTQSGRVFNNSTEGAGLGVSWGDSTVTAGGFRNSFSHPSAFIEYTYTPVHFGTLAFGAGIGLVSGYQHYDGGGYLRPMLGAIADYSVAKRVKLELTIAPLKNAATWSESTRYGVMVNFGLRVGLGGDGAREF